MTKPTETEKKPHAEYTSWVPWALEMLGRLRGMPLSHRSYCDRAGMFVEPPMKRCTCGLDKLLAEIDKGVG